MCFSALLWSDAYSIPKVGGNVKHFFVGFLCASVVSVKKSIGLRMAMSQAKYAIRNPIAVQAALY